MFSDAVYFEGEYGTQTAYRVGEFGDALTDAANRASAAGIRIHAYVLPLVVLGREEWLAKTVESGGGVVTVVRSSAKLTEAVSRFSASGN
jgi:hypothetical protein